MWKKYNQCQLIIIRDGHRLKPKSGWNLGQFGSRKMNLMNHTSPNSWDLRFECSSPWHPCAILVPLQTVYGTTPNVPTLPGRDVSISSVFLCHFLITQSWQVIPNATQRWCEYIGEWCAWIISRCHQTHQGGTWCHSEVVQTDLVQVHFGVVGSPKPGFPNLWLSPIVISSTEFKWHAWSFQVVPHLRTVQL